MKLINLELDQKQYFYKVKNLNQILYSETMSKTHVD